MKTNFKNYEKSEDINAFLKEFLGTGIFASDGAIWKFHRKVAVNMFSRRLLEHSSAVAMTQVCCCSRVGLGWVG